MPSESTVKKFHKFRMPPEVDVICLILGGFIVGGAAQLGQLNTHNFSNTGALLLAIGLGLVLLVNVVSLVLYPVAFLMHGLRLRLNRPYPSAAGSEFSPNDEAASRDRTR